MTAKKGKKPNDTTSGDEFQALRERLPRVVSRTVGTTSTGMRITVSEVQRTVTLAELERELLRDMGYGYPDPEECEEWYE